MQPCVLRRLHPEVGRVKSILSMLQSRYCHVLGCSLEILEIAINSLASYGYHDLIPPFLKERGPHRCAAALAWRWGSNAKSCTATVSIKK